MSLDHLLRHHRRTGSTTALDAALVSLDAMAAGGIYDHLGGGFSRYSVDERWLVPHFEKMLYDNALLARTYLHAWQVTGEPRFLAGGGRDDRLRAGGPVPPRRRALLRARTPTRCPQPGADHAEEGAFYVWTPDAGRGGAARRRARRAHRRGVRLVRHHRGRQLRGRVDPEPAPCTRQRRSDPQGSRRPGSRCSRLAPDDRGRGWTTRS